MRPLLFCVLIVGGLPIGALADASSDDDHGLPRADAYDVATFQAHISLHPHFVMFYAPWFVSVSVFCSYVRVCILFGSVLSRNLSICTICKMRYAIWLWFRLGLELGIKARSGLGLGLGQICRLRIWILNLQSAFSKLCRLTNHAHHRHFD